MVERDVREGKRKSIFILKRNETKNSVHNGYEGKHYYAHTHKSFTFS